MRVVFYNAGLLLSRVCVGNLLPVQGIGNRPGKILSDARDPFFKGMAGTQRGVLLVFSLTSLFLVSGSSGASNLLKVNYLFF